MGRMQTARKYREMNYYQWIVMPKEAKDLREYIIVKDLFKGDGTKIPVWKLEEGQKISDWDHSAYATYRRDGPHWDSLVQMLDIKIISDRLRIFLESTQLDGEVQILPLRLLAQDGTKEISNYFLLHILDPVDCIDLENTEHRLVSEDDDEEDDEIELVTMEPITLNAEAIGDRRLFRLKRHTGTVVIREDLRKKIDSIGFTGFDFIELNVN